MRHHLFNAASPVPGRPKADEIPSGGRTRYVAAGGLS